MLLGFGVHGAASAQFVTNTATSNVTNTNNNLNDNDNNNENNNSQDQSQDQSQRQDVNIFGAVGRDGRGGGGGGGGSKLPKTGVGVAEVGTVGSGTLLLGASLVEMARRRRQWFVPASAGEALATTFVAPQTVEAADLVAQSEGDLLLPYTPPAVDPPSEPDDFITPSF